MKKVFIRKGHEFCKGGFTSLVGNIAPIELEGYFKGCLKI
jgi:hypothetical protein